MRKACKLHIDCHLYVMYTAAMLYTYIHIKKETRLYTCCSCCKIIFLIQIFKLDLKMDSYIMHSIFHMKGALQIITHTLYLYF